MAKEKENAVETTEVNEAPDVETTAEVSETEKEMSNHADDSVNPKTENEAPSDESEPTADIADMDDLTEEEKRILALAESIQLRTHYRAHKLTKASKEEKKDMFSSVHVVTESGELRAETESTMLREDMTELNASAQAKRILEGTIIGCRSINPESDTSTTIAELEFGHGTCNVIIPDYALFNYDIEKYRTKEKQREVAKRVEDMIGSRVRFVVKSFDQKTKTAYADRLKAMEFDSFNNYRRETREGRPRVVPGMLAEGRIVAVRKDSLVVYALGSEAVIKKDETSWFFISDLREVFQIDQMVTVKVLATKEVEVEKYGKEKYNLVLTQLSIKQATVDPMTKHYDYFKVGGKYAATITGITESGTGVFVTLQDKVVCMCAYPKYGMLPTVGQKRVVEVTEKKEENGTKKIYGIFV